MFGLEGKNQNGTAPAAVRRPKRNWLRALALVAVAVVLVAGALTVCLNAPSTREREESAAADYGMSDQMYAPAPMEMPEGGMDMNRAAGSKEKASKVIRTFSFTLSTRQFEQDLAAIRTALNAHEGYVEESRLSSDYGARRTAYMRVRVPKDAVDAFTAELKGIGRALDVSETAEDVSEQYADIQLRLDTQKAKLQRLQEMLRKAVSVEELLKIESSIADTQYQVDSLTGSLKGMDSKVDYSTVTINLKEERQQDTAQVKEETLAERIRSAFGAMLNGIRTFAEDMLVFLVTALPFILLILIVLIVIKVICKRRKKA